MDGVDVSLVASAKRRLPIVRLGESVLGVGLRLLVCRLPMPMNAGVESHRREVHSSRRLWISSLNAELEQPRSVPLPLICVVCSCRLSMMAVVAVDVGTTYFCL